MAAGIPAPRPRASWPLLTLAGLSFIPLLGFLFGSAAVSWGLVSSRPRARLAVILGAIGVLCTFGEVAAVLLLVPGGTDMRASRLAMTQNQLDRLVPVLEGYRRRTGEYPDDLRRLPRAGYFVSVVDQSASLFSQTPFRYARTPDGGYVLSAVGADGLAGTADDIYPSLPDSVLATSGYRGPHRPPRAAASPGAARRPATR